MLAISNLRVRYGKAEAVRDVSLLVRPGRVTLVLGANGAGKTTTLRAISGLVPVNAGQIVLDDVSITGVAPHKLVRKGMVLVPEGRRIFGPLTVFENLRLGAYTAPRATFDADLAQVYEMFPILADRRNGMAGLLSGGEQQMLAFGRGIMTRPRFMLMDEPSMGLAPTMVETVLDGVRTIADSGIGVLMVEQNAEVGLDVADDVVVVARGVVVFSGDAKVARDHSSIVHAFLGESALSEPAEIHADPVTQVQ